MPLNFPSSPALDEVFQRWIWNGYAWVGHLEEPEPYLPLTGGTLYNPGNLDIKGELIAESETHLEKLFVNGESVFGDDVLLHDDPSVALGAATKQYVDGEISGVKNLGFFSGSFDTHADLPANTSAIPNLTMNDFVTVRADETKSGLTTRYIATAIAGNGAITWTYDLTYSTDVTGKMDKVTSATAGEVAVFGTAGQVVATNDVTLANMSVSGQLQVGSIPALTVDNDQFSVNINGTVILQGNPDVRSESFFRANAGAEINQGVNITGSVYMYENPSQFGITSGEIYASGNTFRWQQGSAKAEFSSSQGYRFTGSNWPAKFVTTAQFQLGTNGYIYWPPWLARGDGPYIEQTDSWDLLITSGSQMHIVSYAQFYSGFYVQEENGQQCYVAGSAMYFLSSGTGNYGRSSSHFTSSPGANQYVSSFNSGNNGVYIYASGSNAIYVQNGEVRKPGGGSWAATSDVRTKTDVHQYTKGLDAITKLNPIAFRYNGRFRMIEDGKTHIGLHAEEVKPIMPELVHAVRGKLDYDDDETDVLHIDPSALTYALINACKELAARVAELEKAR